MGRGCGCSPATAVGAQTGTDFLGSKKSKMGTPTVVWPGWENFDSRASVQTDINSLPIVPVHFQQWPGMQYQLSNGWQNTNYGLKTPYDTYIRMLYSSNNSPGAPLPLPGERLQPQAGPQPSQLQLQNQVFAPAANRQGNGNGGAGVLAPGVSLAGRRFYG